MRSFIVRHWRGEYSLAFSFWAVGVAGNVAVFALVALIAAGFRAGEFNPYLLMGVLATIWVTAASAVVFQAVGICRSGLRYWRENTAYGKSGTWGLAALAAVAIWAFGLAFQLVHTGLPQLGEAWRMSFLGDPGVPDYSVRLMRDGTEAEIAGGFKYGLARDVEVIFSAAPNLKVVHLNSGGGRLGEALRLAKLIRDRRLDTYTSASCSSACIIAFLAGHGRWLKDDARLGFHHESFAGSENFDSMRKLLLESGLQPPFVDRAVAPSSTTMWYPNAAELIEARVISGIADNYRFAASGLGVRPDAQALAQHLRRTALFAAIEASDPTAFAAIADNFQRNYVAGVPEGRIMDDLRNNRIRPLILGHMVYADDQLLADYAALMADQYEALGQHDATVCFQYAARGSGASAARLLPEDLKARELALSEALLRSTARRAPAAEDTVQAIYREIFKTLAQRFGVEQVRLLADPAKVQPSQYAAYCGLAVAMFRAVSALPREQAGAVMSRIFSGAYGGK